MRSIPSGWSRSPGSTTPPFRAATRRALSTCWPRRRGRETARRGLDDRYLFLETLLAARDRLLLFYPGASQRDAAEKAPSVVVAELLDLLDRSFRRGGRPDGPRAPGRKASAPGLEPAVSSPATGAPSRAKTPPPPLALLAPRQGLPPFLPAGFSRSSRRRSRRRAARAAPRRPDRRPTSRPAATTARKSSSWRSAATRRRRSRPSPSRSSPSPASLCCRR